MLQTINRCLFRWLAVVSLSASLILLFHYYETIYVRLCTLVTYWQFTVKAPDDCHIVDFLIVAFISDGISPLAIKAFHVRLFVYILTYLLRSSRAWSGFHLVWWTGSEFGLVGFLLFGGLVGSYPLFGKIWSLGRLLNTLHWVYIDRRWIKSLLYSRISQVIRLTQIDPSCPESFMTWLFKNVESFWKIWQVLTHCNIYGSF